MSSIARQFRKRIEARERPERDCLNGDDCSQLVPEIMDFPGGEVGLGKVSYEEWKFGYRACACCRMTGKGRPVYISKHRRRRIHAIKCPGPWATPSTKEASVEVTCEVWIPLDKVDEGHSLCGPCLEDWKAAWAEMKPTK